MTFINSKHFSYDAATKTFTAEISDLSFGNSRNIWIRAFPDSCDDGIYLLSARTGHVVTYYVTETKRDADGDITLWELSPVPRSIASAKDTKVVIFND